MNKDRLYILADMLERGECPEQIGKKVGSNMDYLGQCAARQGEGQ